VGVQLNAGVAVHATGQFAHRIDVAVATPALNIRKLIVDYTDEEFDQAVNLKGAFHFMRRFGAPMMKQGSGSLILCSSMRAVTIEPGLGIYAAPKAGIAQMVKGSASEVGSYGVRVNAVMPSIIETKLTAPLKERPAIYDTYAAYTVFNRWGSRRRWARRWPFSHLTQPASLAVRCRWMAGGPRSTARPRA
jgi:NAD(P)-dependent dehydrogenase (short-subunit alcohol dehydrogenase family)